MSVRIKILLVICLTFLALLGILYFTSQWFLVQDTIVMEEKSTTRDVVRLQASLDEQIAKMSATVGDWAPWDDTLKDCSKSVHALGNRRAERLLGAQMAYLRIVQSR